MAPDLRASIAEATVAVEAARAAAESLANHGIVPSADLEALLRFLGEAIEALEKIEPAPASDEGGQ